MLTQEEGPYNLIEKFRNWTLQSRLSPLFCFLCTSVWVAGLLTLFTPEPLLNWLIISTGSIFINLIYERLA